MPATMMQSEIVVPRSGSSRTRTQKRPTTSPSGFISSPIVRGVGRRASSAQAQTQTAIFASSEGWTLIGPTRNQRWAPLIGGATTSTATHERQRADEQDRRERPQAVVVEARGQSEQEQARERIGALLDEERHRVARPERRRGRGGAEDHHEPERDEAERDENEEALLEVSVGGVLHPWSFCTSFPNSSPRCS